jgi:DNA-binding NarL/FixJ family response regulator
VIRILLVDNDSNYRDGLKQLLTLDDDLVVIGEASTADEACRACRSLKPDVVIINADLPRDAGVEAIWRMGEDAAASQHRPPIICLAVYPDQHDAALQAGAVRFLRKDGSRRELVAAIRGAVRAE